VLVALSIGAWSLSRRAPEAPDASEPPHRAVIQGSLGASFVHTARRSEGGAEESVRLREGTIQVAVQHLAARERFMVVAQDAEVEVRGTRFEVEVANDHLRRVRVFEGLVEVRRTGAPAFLLAANEAWSAPDPTPIVASATPAATAPPSTESKPSVVRPPKKRAPPPDAARSNSAPEEAGSELRAAPDSAIEALFVQGWSRLKRQEYADAARIFREVIRDAKGSPLAEDASYLLTIALSGEGRRTEAVQAMEAFLSSYPHSARAGKVRVALGWLRLKSGASTLARDAFQDALGDPDREVREGAQEGLRALP
jgi:TolA-binding protein